MHIQRKVLLDDVERTLWRPIDTHITYDCESSVIRSVVDIVSVLVPIFDAVQTCSYRLWIVP